VVGRERLKFLVISKIEGMKERGGSFLTEEEKIGGEETRAEGERDRRLERANPRPPAGAPRGKHQYLDTLA